ncbi:MAG: PKD domain-containing protein, partial [Solirubrobacteraceae bacterium]
ASTPDAGGTITDYSWNFGDGTTTDTGPTPATSHTYTSPGLYTVTLTTTDDLGLTATASGPVTVDAAPTASFTAWPNPSTLGVPANFDASASSDPEGTITDYSWNFGDGSTATGADPSHAFAAPGTYTVILTVTNDGGQTATTSQTATVDSPATARSTSALSPPPLKSPPPPLTGHLTAPRHQKIAYVLKHGLRLTTSLNQSGTASFQITIPSRTSPHTNRPATHRRANLKPAVISLFRVRSRAVARGTHPITLKLSSSAKRKVSDYRTIVLTVFVTMSNGHGTAIKRSTKVTLNR